MGKCIAAGLGIGLPLLLLAPLGLATQVNLPGASQWQESISRQLAEANTELQKRVGLYNPITRSWHGWWRTSTRC